MTRKIPATALRSISALFVSSFLGMGNPAAGAPPSSTPVVELRQYKIVAGKRDAFVKLFEDKFVDSQEELGVRLVGQFRDKDDPNRFVWIRQFADRAARVGALQAFYFGPVWKANRETANPMLDDNDNVLLLRPAYPGSGFAEPSTKRPAGAESTAPGLVVATIYYLWKDPNEAFSSFFEKQLAPAFASAGLPVLGSFVTETTPNDFPRLPVRQSEKVFVTFTRVPDIAAYEKGVGRLHADPRWRSSLARRLFDFEERSPQVLRLQPTPRSRLR